MERLPGGQFSYIPQYLRTTGQPLKLDAVACTHLAFSWFTLICSYISVFPYVYVISTVCLSDRWTDVPFLFLRCEYLLHQMPLIHRNTFQRTYAISGRQLKRIESVKRSPVFASYSETLSGLRSIRAYRQQDRFVEKADWLLDNSVKSYFLVITSNRYGFRLEVKMLCRGPELFKKKGTLFQGEIYLPGIFMPSWISGRYDCA